jgi:hypothetical protein
LGAGEWSLALRRSNMSISIRTDHLLLDEQGPTITAFGYEISWLHRELMIERLDTKDAKRPGRTWHWSKRHGRWTTRNDGSIVDGWV